MLSNSNMHGVEAMLSGVFYLSLWEHEMEESDVLLSVLLTMSITSYFVRC